MKKVIVTGINGLIGQYIAEPLKDLGFEVYGIGTKYIKTDKFNYIKIDINNIDKLRKIFNKIEAKYLVHLAWDMNDLNSNNHFKLLASSINMLEYFKESGGKKVVSIGTCFEYKYKRIPLKENDKLNPTTIYAKCKNYLREISELYCDKNNIDFCWARIFYTYGANEHQNRLFPYIINSLNNGKKVSINHSHLKRDYMFAGDVAKAVALILNSEFSGVINICSGKAISLKDFALTIAKNMNKENLLELNELYTNEPKIVVGDNSKLIKEIKFNKFKTLQENCEEKRREEKRNSLTEYLYFTINIDKCQYSLYQKYGEYAA